jgi:mRNA-degrading endonuclease RelE of RelBE toxin-antitoxin system
VRTLVLTDQAKLDLKDLDRATRLRVGDFRVRFYYPDAGTVRVNRIQNRKDAYR